MIVRNLGKMIDVNRIVEKINLDLDSKDLAKLDRMQKEAVKYGVIATTASAKGFHIEVILKKPVPLRQSLWIRFYLQDDFLRLLFDCLRIISDVDNLDVAWDIKKRVQIKDIIDKIEVLSHVP